MATDYDAKISALEEAAASGLLIVEANGEKMTYRSMTDLLAALTYMKAQRAQQSATPAYAATLATFGND